jgi:hypothetical protein
MPVGSGHARAENTRHGPVTRTDHGGGNSRRRREQLMFAANRRHGSPPRSSQQSRGYLRPQRIDRLRERAEDVVGSFAFPESEILSNIYASPSRTRVTRSETKFNLGPRQTTIPALKDGSINLKMEYNATCCSSVRQRTPPARHPRSTPRLRPRCRRGSACSPHPRQGCPRRL